MIRTSALNGQAEAMLRPWLQVPRVLPRLRWLVHTPYARLWHAQLDGRPVGIAAVLRFGPQARIVLLHHRTAARDARGELIAQLLHDLQAEGIGTISVLAHEAEAPLFHAHAFVAHERVLRCAGGRFLEATHAEVVPLQPRHRFGVLHLDRRATGMDRHALLTEHEFLGQVYEERGVVRGFALPLLGDGLIVADAPHAGLELQRWLFPTQRHLLLPATCPALGHLRECGYACAPAGTRLVLGPAVARPELLYAEPFGAV